MAAVMWAKRVDWLCQRPTETGPEWLTRLWKRDVDEDEREFWRRVQENAEWQLHQAYPDYFPAP